MSTYNDACQRAKERSEMYACTVYVCILIVAAPIELREAHGITHIAAPNGYFASDWHDNSVVRTYVNGKVV